MKKAFCLLLAVIMVLSLWACSDTKDPGNTTVNPEDVLNEITLPLTTEKKELSVWLVWTNDKVADPNELEGIQYLEELTNVHINWITISAADAGEKFQLLQSSKNLPDIIVYSTGVTADSAIADGWAMDMTNLIASYMPNYRKFLETHEVERKLLSSDDGTVKTAASLAGDDNGYRGELQWAGLHSAQT